MALKALIMPLFRIYLLSVSKVMHGFVNSSHLLLYDSHINCILIPFFSLFYFSAQHHSLLCGEPVNINLFHNFNISLKNKIHMNLLECFGLQM